MQRDAGPPMSLDQNSRIVVVGASLAGTRAAEELRRAGYTGDVVVIGAEAHAPYDRPPLSKQFLAGSWGRERIELRPAPRWTELGIELRLGERARGVDVAARRVAMEGGELIGFDGLVLAPGATPRKLDLAAGLSGVFELRTVDDAEAIVARMEAGATRVVVVGAGFIGSEVAATCRARGAEVTVVEVLDVPLARVLGEQMGGICGDLHRRNGVELLVGTRVENLEGDASGEIRRVVLSGGRSLDADLVVVGVGVVPETGWLADSGLEISDGLVADAELFVADGVVVAGDAARWLDLGQGEHVRIEHWTNAAEQGVVAARNLLAGRGRGEPYVPVPYFWSDQYGVKIQVLGYPRPSDDVEIVEGSLEEGRFVALYGRAGLMSAALGFGMPGRLMAYRKLLEERASMHEAMMHARGS